MQEHEGRPFVLLVEDDPDIQELATMALETIGGLRVHACSDGESALVQAAKLQPDMIVLDWRMPGLNGGETLLRLKQDPATRDIPVVFMTASVQNSEVGRMKAMGALDIIPKPFDPVELPERIRQIWLQSQQQGPAS